MVIVMAAQMIIFLNEIIMKKKKYSLPELKLTFSLKPFKFKKLLKFLNIKHQLYEKYV